MPNIARIPAALLSAVFLVFTTGASTALAQAMTTTGVVVQKELPRVLLVEGQAFDSLGGGVNGAIVTLTIDAGGGVLGTTTTSGYGDFKIDHATTQRGPATLTVETLFHKKFVAKVELGTGGFPPFVEAAMQGNLRLSGTVTAARDGAPVATAQVLVKNGFEKWTARSRDDGTFIIDGLSPGAVTLIVDADGFTRHQARISDVATAAVQAITLQRERVAELLITDLSGRPVKGTHAEILEPGGQDYRQFVTAADGKIVVRGLRRDAVTLRARLSHPDHVADIDFDRTLNLPADADRSMHTLVLQPAGRLIGCVTDRATGKPLPGVRLIAGAIAYDGAPRAWTDLAGNFELAGVPTGPQVITLQVAGHAPHLVTAVVVADESVKVNAALAPSRVVIGTVVDPDGVPLPDVYVNVTAWREHATLTLRALTDATGQFELVDAPTDDFGVALHADGFEPAVNQPIVADRSSYRFTLQPARPRAAGHPQIAAPAPPLTVKTIAGTPLDWAALRGKVVLVDFWATWCGPCLAELPNLRSVYQRFGERDDFVMLSLTREPPEREVRSMIEAQRMVWHHVCGPDAAPVFDAYGVTAIPALFLVDRQGRIAATNIRGAQIADAVAAQLAPEP